MFSFVLCIAQLSSIASACVQSAIALVLPHPVFDRQCVPGETHKCEQAERLENDSDGIEDQSEHDAAARSSSMRRLRCSGRMKNSW
jgi:hypothetical protein